MVTANTVPHSCADSVAEYIADRVVQWLADGIPSSVETQAAERVLDLEEIVYCLEGATIHTHVENAVTSAILAGELFTKAQVDALRVD